jgi:hypothetical protein
MISVENPTHLVGYGAIVLARNNLSAVMCSVLEVPGWEYDEHNVYWHKTTDNLSNLQIEKIVFVDQGTKIMATQELSVLFLDATTLDII